MKKTKKETHFKKGVILKGFTLIELIVVTIILGVLAMVTIPRYMNPAGSTAIAAEDAKIASIEDGLGTYAM